MKNYKEDITIETTDIKKNSKGMPFTDPCTQLNNLREMDQFLKTTNYQNLTEDKIDDSNILI